MNILTDNLIGLAWSQVWQVTVLAAVVAIATRLVCRRRPHLAYVLWMLVVLKCLTPPLWSSPTGLFCWAQLHAAAPVAENRLPAAVSAPSEAKRDSFVEKMMHPRKRLTAISTSIGAETAAPIQTIEATEPPRRWNLSWTAIAAVIWLLGVLTFAGILLWKWTAFGRILRRSGSLSSAELELLVVRTADRIGLRRAVRLRIVSEPIGPAVFGLWRPVIVLPEALISPPSPIGRGAGDEGQAKADAKRSEAFRATALTLALSQRERGLARLQYLEPTVAHELVHVRRGDAFVGVLQMAVQILWWFHPLLWWANREMCRRREQCCDEEVVAGLGCSSAAYARCLLDVLEWECCRSRRRLLSAVPGVGSAEITTTRLEHIMDDAKRFHRRTPRWTWGILAMAMLLVLPGRALVLGQNAESPSAKDTNATKDVKDDGERVPTLAEIARANDAAWAAIRSVDMEYLQTTQQMLDGQIMVDLHSPGRWSKAGKAERLRKFLATVKASQYRDGRIYRDGPIWENTDSLDDYFFDGKEVRHLCDRDPNNKNRGELSFHDQKGFFGIISPSDSLSSVATQELEPLRYFSFGQGDSPVTLSTIVASWKVSLKRKQPAAAGDAIWLIHAEYPPTNDKDKLAGSFIDIEVNANKGFLAQKATFYENNVATRTSDGASVGIYTVEEIKEFQDCGGVYFPKKTEGRLLGETLQPDFKKGGYYSTTLTTTKLSVNRPLPGDALDFRFPENLDVQQKHAGTESITFLVWGPDNKPAKQFNSVEAFNRYTAENDLARLKRRVQKNVGSKKPKDVVERGEYAMYTKDFDAALAAFSQVISTATATEDRSSALSGRGFVYLLYKPDYEKAAADFTEIIRLASKEKDEDATMVYILRGLAYAHQEKTLGKAVADLTIALAEKDPPGCLSEDDQYWAYLVRAAILARQNKNADELALAMKDVEKVLSVHRGAEAYAIAVAICEKEGNHAKAAKFRDAAKQQTEKPIECDGMEADFAAVAHDFVVILLREIEKK